MNALLDSPPSIARVEPDDSEEMQSARALEELLDSSWLIDELDLGINTELRVRERAYRHWGINE